MRPYPRNSPQAAARILALTVMADRDLGAAERALLDELAVHRHLGLSREALHAVFDEFCEDLLASKQLAWSDDCPVDEYTLAELMGDIDDPAVRQQLWDWCVRLAEADDRVAAGESIVLMAATAHWGLDGHHGDANADADAGATGRLPQPA
jgi:hypothetical protein